jgi:hypothetical protein
VRDGPLQRAASREAQRSGIRRRTSWPVKRDGSRAEARPTRWSAYHGEAEAQEGQVDCRGANRVPAMRTDSHADEGPEDEERGRPYILGNVLCAPRLPHLGKRGKASRGEERQEGMPAAKSRRGCVAEAQPPVGLNPKSATRLKMAGRRREEEAAVRLRKPVSGTVGGRMGPAVAIPAKPGRSTGQLASRGFPSLDAL